MHCPNCGNSNPDDAIYCTNCGQRLVQPPPLPRQQPPQYGVPTYSLPPGPVYEHIPNYLVQAILVTIFCCLPAGIVSIVFAAQVNGKVARGDLTGARSDSQKAKKWAWISFGLGLAVAAIYLFLA